MLRLTEAEWAEARAPFVTCEISAGITCFSDDELNAIDQWIEDHCGGWFFRRRLPPTTVRYVFEALADYTLFKLRLAGTEAFDANDQLRLGDE